MTMMQQQRHPLTGQCYSSDREIMNEIAEAIAQEVGDVRYGSTVVDAQRRQITARLEDGRKLRLTVIIE
jgi:hypothetical protein